MTGAMSGLTRQDIAKALGTSVPEGGRALIVGAGASGEAAAKLLRASGVECALYDDGAHAGWSDDRSGLDFDGVADGIAFAVASPSVPYSHPLLTALRKRGVSVFSELQLAAAVCPARKIAVSGTNGKTTTVSLIEHILRAAGVNARALGNIGVPFSAEGADMPSFGVAVVEVSSFMLEYGGIGSDIAVLLNVTPDHLDRHGSFAEYARVKARLFEAQSGGDRAVFNADDAIAAAIAGKVAARAYYFSTRGRCRGAYVDGADIFFDDGDRYIRTASGGEEYPVYCGGQQCHERKRRKRDLGLYHTLVGDMADNRKLRYIRRTCRAYRYVYRIQGKKQKSG